MLILKGVLEEGLKKAMQPLRTKEKGSNESNASVQSCLVRSAYGLRAS